jgi:hypothetical protein
MTAPTAVDGRSLRAERTRTGESLRCHQELSADRARSVLRSIVASQLKAGR